MESVPLYLLSPYGNREHALDLIRTATGLPLPAAHSLVLTLDAVSAAVLRTAGIPFVEAWEILSALWQQPERPADPRPQPAPPPRGAEDYLYRLGERIHIIRRIRRLTTEELGRRVGVRPPLVRDMEAGAAWPTLRMLLRLAEALDVSVVLLVDDSADPPTVLRLLGAGRAAA